MIDIPYLTPYIQILLCCLGLCSHHVAVLAEMSSAKGKKVGLREYTRTRPYKLTLSFLGAVIGFIALSQLGELTSLTAFGIGVASSDVSDRAGRIAIGKLPQV